MPGIASGTSVFGAVANNNGRLPFGARGGAMCDGGKTGSFCIIAQGYGTINRSIGIVANRDRAGANRLRGAIRIIGIGANGNGLIGRTGIDANGS